VGEAVLVQRGPVVWQIQQSLVKSPPVWPLPLTIWTLERAIL